MKHHIQLITLLLFAYPLMAIEQHFLYAPTRGANVPVATSNQTKQTECKLCTAVVPGNPREFVLARTHHFTVMFNLFPYGPGHILITANDHGSTLDSLTKKQRNELAYITSVSAAHLKEAFKCPGLNMGYNEGRCAGSSIPGHFHVHLLPRYEHNEKAFLHTITNTQLVQWDFNDMHKKLAPLFAHLNKQTTQQKSIVAQSTATTPAA